MVFIAGRLVHGHHAGAAQAEVVLQRDPRAIDLALAGGAAQLVGQFVALGQAGRAQRVPLGQQAAGRIGDDLAAVGVVAVVDEFVGAAFRAQAERFVGDQLVVGEAVVQFDHVRSSGPMPAFA
jgi:hypothetical protein